MATSGEYDDMYGDYDYDDEELPPAERELAEDAAWKLIQKNTFTRWANEHLKTVNRRIEDLEFDLSDGLNLVYLVEILSGKKFKYVNKRPGFRTQKLENVTMVLEFLENEEKIKIINIGQFLFLFTSLLRFLVLIRRLHRLIIIIYYYYLLSSYL